MLQAGELGLAEEAGSNFAIGVVPVMTKASSFGGPKTPQTFQRCVPTPGAVREQRWIAVVMSSARARGYLPNPVRKQKASLVPERWLNDRPQSQALIKQLLDEPGSEIGRLMHQVTSAVMHGQQFHGLLLMLATAEAKSSRKDVSLVLAGMSLAKTALWTAPVLLALLRTRRSAERYYGWQGAEDLAAKQDATLRLWRSCIGAGPAPELPARPVATGVWPRG